MVKLAISNNNQDLTMHATSLLIQEVFISDLWNVDVIGITDSARKKIAGSVFFKGEIK